MRTTRGIGRRWWLMCLFVCIGGAQGILRGQAGEEPIPVPGFQRDQAYFGLLPFENIDTGSGNLILTFTDWALPGYNRIDLVFQRTFNSASGWTFGLAGFPMKIQRPDGPQGSPPDFVNPAGLPEIVTADGGVHRTWWDGDSVSPKFVSREFWRYTVQGRLLELPSGIQCLYDVTGSLVRVQDRFANRIELVNETFGTQTYPTLIRQILGDGRIRELALTYTTVVYQSVSYRLLTGATFDNRSWTYQYGAPRGIDLVAAAPPVGPGWSFVMQSAPGVPPQLTVTVPQGGQAVYTFADVPQGDPRAGILRSRETRDGGILTSQWTFEFQDEATTPPAYRRILNGPEGVRLVHGYGAGGSADGGYVLRWQEVWDAGSNTLVQREEETYTATQVTEVSNSVLNLVNASSVTRDARTYTSTFFYHAGDVTGRFADYGRPWSSREVGDAGTRDVVRTFDYGILGYLLDRVASVTATVAGESAAESWSYNATTGFLETATRFGITTTFTANASTGALSSVTDPHGHVASLTYDWGTPKNVTTPMYGITRTVNADGSVASETRRGATTTFEYDAVGRLTWLKPPLGYWTETQYDNAAGRSVVVRRSDGQGASVQTTTYFDPFGRPVATENSVGVRTRVAYDALSRKTYESLPYTTVDVGRIFRYDVLGRVREVETGDTKKVTYTYSNGSDVTITDREGRVTFRDFAAFGSPDDARLVAVRDAENQTWSYTYNVLRRLTRVNQPGGPAREWQYSGDLLTRNVQPESGETTYTYIGGRLASTTTPRGSFTLGYDNNDRLTSIDAPGTAHDLTFQYDESDNRTVVENSFVRNVYEFDLTNRLLRRRETVTGEPERQTLYAYDGWDNLTSITYPSGILVNYTYDLAGRATSVTRGLERRMVAEILEYHPSGSPARLWFANGIEETYTYDANRYWLNQISGGPIQLTYTHDGVGNVQSIADGRPQFNQSFTYDGVNRLRQVFGWAANDYQYDTLGNRTSKASPAVTYAYDAVTKRLTTATGNAQIPEVGTYSYDGSGNLIGDPSGTYTYTPFNMLETATVGGMTATYRYDGNNERKVRIMPNETVLFYHGLGDALLSEYSRRAGEPEGHWVRDHLYLSGRPVASVSRR